MGHLPEAQDVKWIPVLIYGPVREAIHAWPLEVKKELGSVLTRLQKGESIGMPDVRPMPKIGAGVSEIRIGERTGQYRAIYSIRMEFGILLFHAFQKKSRTMPEREKKTARRRLEDFLKELGEVPDETKRSKGW
jgi:phage-related protein